MPSVPTHPLVEAVEGLRDAVDELAGLAPLYGVAPGEARQDTSPLGPGDLVLYGKHRGVKVATLAHPSRSATPSLAPRAVQPSAPLRKRIAPTTTVDHALASLREIAADASNAKAKAAASMLRAVDAPERPAPAAAVSFETALAMLRDVAADPRDPNARRAARDVRAVEQKDETIMPTKSASPKDDEKNADDSIQQATDALRKVLKDPEATEKQRDEAKKALKALGAEEGDEDDDGEEKKDKEARAVAAAKAAHFEAVVSARLTTEERGILAGLDRASVVETRAMQRGADLVMPTGITKERAAARAAELEREMKQGGRR